MGLVLCWQGLGLVVFGLVGWVRLWLVWFWSRHPDIYVYVFGISPSNQSILDGMDKTSRNTCIFLLSAHQTKQVYMGWVSFSRVWVWLVLVWYGLVWLGYDWFDFGWDTRHINFWNQHIRQKTARCVGFCFSPFGFGWFQFGWVQLGYEWFNFCPDTKTYIYFLNQLIKPNNSRWGWFSS